MKSRPWGARVVFGGDHNINRLPALWNAPLHLKDTNQDCDSRGLQQVWFEAMGLDLHIPSRVIGSPGGPHAELAFLLPVSRVPVGDQTGDPSLLDYAAAHPSLVQELLLDWELCDSDHATLVAEIKCDSLASKRRRVKRLWKCRDIPGCSTWVQLHAPVPHDIRDMTEVCTYFQDMWSDVQPCKKRSAARVPIEVRIARYHLGHEPSEHLAR